MGIEQGSNDLPPVLNLEQVEGQEDKLKISKELMAKLEDITTKNQGKDKLDWKDLNELRLIVNLVADFNKGVDEKILVKKALGLGNSDAKETFIDAKDVDEKLIDVKVNEVQAKVNKMLAKYDGNTYALNEDLKVLLNVDNLLNTVNDDSGFSTRMGLSETDWKQREKVAKRETQINPGKEKIVVAQADTDNPFSVFRAYNDLKNNTNRINNQTDKILNR